MYLFGLAGHSGVEPLTDRFVSLSIGNVLVLKACGFIEAHGARILDISEEQLRLRLGQFWWERLLRGQSQKAIEILLQIDNSSPREPGSHRDELYHRRYCTMDVSIIPTDGGWTPDDFHWESRRLLWSLRSHFLACSPD
jgi:hypothetical protein